MTQLMDLLSNKEEKRGLVLLSGGMDSTVLMHSLHRDGMDLHAISFNYKQRHHREIILASWQADSLSVPFTEVYMDLNLLGSSQTSMDVKVPHGHYAADNMKTTVVPNRNMFMLSCAAAYAISRDIPQIFIAAHAGDHDIYPDCRAEFIASFNETVRLGNYTSAEVVTPFINVSKAAIVSLGLSLGVDFNHTHTCYEGNFIACGRCGTCVERLEAFALCGAEDPLDYADREYWKTVVGK